ncbi:MAG TPA: hypothetical protein VHT04_15830 [Stellaceae bacterium]|nr:hypothetical protein [Stellaceae bacterium]
MIRAIVTVLSTLLLVCGAGHANQSGSGAQHREMAGTSHGDDGAAVTFTDPQSTVEALKRAQSATEKYQDVRAAEADGYRVFGPYVAGMGFHYVNTRLARAGFDAERPPILLYEKDDDAPNGLWLVGVSYIMPAHAGDNEQPVAAPFPRALAAWHRHANICLFADRSIRTKLNDVDCIQQGGRFIAETDWMLHAWIWKDNPAGVFSPTNPEIH